MFIVLEGSDGSGKTTQFKLLAERLRAAGHEVDIYDFPRYEEPSSYFVKRYLNGDYGPAADVSPYTASFFYALDRFEAAPLIRQSLARGRIVLANRYTGSNMAHQGAKFTKPAEQRGYFLWADSLEFQLLGIPRPSVNVFLRAPAEISFELIKRKAARSYTARSHDEHEADLNHLKLSVSAYDTLCELFPKDFKAVDCVDDGAIMPVTAINNRIWELLKPLLPRPARPGRTAIVNLNAETRSSPRKISGEQHSGQPSARTKADTVELKDVSLLLLTKIRSHGFEVSYSLKWPPGAKPRLSYYVPAGVSPKLARQYTCTLDKLAKMSSQMRRRLPQEEIENLDAVIPLAALAEASVRGSKPALGQLLIELDAIGLAESVQVGKIRTERTREPQALGRIIKQMSESHPSGHGATPDSPVSLAGVFPRNEFDLLADSLYPFSNLSRGEISSQVDSMSYEQKSKALKALCASDGDKLLQKLLYRFDIIGDTSKMETLISQLGPSETDVQPPTPRYGYEVPEAIEDAGLADIFIDCFDASLELFSAMQEAKLEVAAGYAVLRGHKQRWQLSVDGRSVFGRTAVNPNTEAMRATLREQAAESHPLIAGAVSPGSPPRQEPAAKEDKTQNAPGKNPRSRRR